MAEQTVLAQREAFARQADSFRAELLAYCYRMLGSVHDAEDAVQETYLRAWRAQDRFEGRSSLRVWLYRIATNACLTALERGSRRPLPSGMGAPSDDPDATLLPGPAELVWLQPIPDSLLDPASTDPASIVASRESLRLALIAALQHLPARQRVVLILRDVLAWRTAEVAAFLDTTTVSVKSALQRARAQLRRVGPGDADQVIEPDGPDHRALLGRYLTAFEHADVDGLLRLLREDATFEMPPIRTWFAGRAAIGRFLAARVLGSPGSWRLVPTRANGQPAFAMYLRDADGVHRAHAVQVLTVAGSGSGSGIGIGIARIVAFLDPELFARFGLPLVHRRRPG